MDQAFKQAEEYRRKSKVLSNVSRIAFTGSLIVSAVALFIPYLLFIFVIVVPLGLATVLLTEIPAVVYRFKARKEIRTVITIPDPSLKKEQTQDIASIIVLALIAVVVGYVFTITIANYIQAFS
jgi:integral membrane sensor domain MASE1